MLITDYTMYYWAMATEIQPCDLNHVSLHTYAVPLALAHCGIDVYSGPKTFLCAETVTSQTPSQPVKVWLLLLETDLLVSENMYVYDSQLDR